MNTGLNALYVRGGVVSVLGSNIPTLNMKGAELGPYDIAMTLMPPTSYTL